MTSIIDALRSLRPGAEFNLRGDDLSGLEWLDETQPQPADAEIMAEVARLAALPPPVPTPAEKLAAVGLTVEDLRALLAQ